jgi:hypothetical protein
MDEILSNPMRQLLDREIASGERLIWYAQPRPGRLAWRATPLVLFGIPWTAFAVFWMCGAAGFSMPHLDKDMGPMSWMPLLFPLFGLPFVLIGLGMLLSPLWLMRKASRTLYAITDRRAIVFSGGWSTTITSYGPERLTQLTRKERPDGSGDIIIAPLLMVNNYDQGRRTPWGEGLFGVAQVHEVEELLRKIKPATEG